MWFTEENGNAGTWNVKYVLLWDAEMLTCNENTIH